MSTHQTNKDKPRARKCRHFCFSFDLHNYCPTCRESGKGDDLCVSFEAPCDICASFTDEQMNKIQHRKRYIKNKRRTLLVQKMMSLIFWVRATGIPSLVPMQTLRVLQTIYLPHPHVLSPYPSVHCLSKLKPKLSHPPQVLPYSRKLKQI